MSQESMILSCCRPNWKVSYFVPLSLVFMFVLAVGISKINFAEIVFDRCIVHCGFGAR